MRAGIFFTSSHNTVYSLINTIIRQSLTTQLIYSQRQLFCCNIFNSDFISCDVIFCKFSQDLIANSSGIQLQIQPGSIVQPNAWLFIVFILKRMQRRPRQEPARFKYLRAPYVALHHLRRNRTTDAQLLQNPILCPLHR